MAICAGELLEAGREILDPVLAPHGFHWVLERSGEGSGGRFVSGAYVRGNRRLELHSRFSLGLVSYSLGDRCVGHTDYRRVALAPGERSLYPGFPTIRSMVSATSLMTFASMPPCFGRDP